jgi:hypothetical protein
MPKAAVLLTILLLGSPSWAASLVSVAKGASMCRTMAGSCYEWRVTQDETLRFVAIVDEQGGDWSFFRRSEDGRYTHLFNVYPAMRDTRRPDVLFWGYPWDISGIALSDGPETPHLMVSFDHDHFEYDGNWQRGDWQRSVPFVLFTGTATQP